MEAFILSLLAVALMFSGGNCQSHSMSCSTVNGRTICNEESGPGNFAGASSGAFSNGQNSYQQTSAQTANTQNGQSSSSQQSAGNLPPGVYVGPPQPQGPFDPFAFAGLPNPFGMLGGGGGAGAFAFGRR